MRAVRVLALLAVFAVAGQAAASTYTLRRGDTLATVARKLGVPVQALAEANGIANVHRVRAGDVLVVPRPVTEVTHVVKRGENLATIARRYGASSRAIATRNQLDDPDLVQAGDRLIIPGRGGAQATAVAPASTTMICPLRGEHSIVHNWRSPRPGGRQHQGNDLFARRGTHVVASVDGVLRHVSGPTAGFAYYLTAADGTLYYGAHLASYVASPGPVNAGQVIGTVGDSGNARGLTPHLHFEVKPGGGPSVDPWTRLLTAC